MLLHKKMEARSQFQIAHWMGASRCRGSRIALDPKQELRANQEALDGALNSEVEAAFRLVPAV